MITQNVPACLCKTSSTAPIEDKEKDYCRVTHPFHPRCGAALEVVRIRKNWGLDRVYYACPAMPDRLCSMPTSWTDAAPQDPFVAISAGRSAFRVSDLLALAETVDGIRSRHEDDC